MDHFFILLTSADISINFVHDVGIFSASASGPERGYGTITSHDTISLGLLSEFRFRSNCYLDTIGLPENAIHDL